jgi:putative ATPase
MKDLGYGRDYQYSHDFENSYSYQKYFPDKMEERTYYTPSPFGFEKEVRKRLDWWEGLKKQQQAKENKEKK